MNIHTRTIILCAAMLLCVPVQASETVIGVTIKAHHFRGDGWEQYNPGLTYEHRGEVKSGAQFATGAGLIRDSLGNWSPFASAGLAFHTGEHFRIGARAVLLYRQESSNGSRPGIMFAPIPFVEYWNGNAGVAVAYLPDTSPRTGKPAAALLSLQFRF